MAGGCRAWCCRLRKWKPSLPRPTPATPWACATEPCWNCCTVPGLRRYGSRHLAVYDADLRAASSGCAEGKGRKDRVVPIGERAWRGSTSILFRGKAAVADLQPYVPVRERLRRPEPARLYRHAREEIQGVRRDRTSPRIRICCACLRHPHARGRADDTVPASHARGMKSGNHGHLYPRRA